MRITCWKKIDVTISADLRAFVVIKFHKSGRQKFCLQDVQESMDDAHPLFAETERLRALHGDVLFRREEF